MNSISQQTSESVNQLVSIPDLGLSSALGVFSPEVHGGDIEELKKVKKAKKSRGIR